MDINGLSQVMAANYENNKVGKDIEKKPVTETVVEKAPAEGAAAEYEKSEATEAEKTVKYDAATIEKMKAEAELKTAQLRSIVEKMMLKQGQQFTTLEDAFDMIKEGTIEVDDETAVEAAKEVAEDGYWGVEQTSDRIIDFATALTGGDPDKIEEMREAFQKGYKQAEETWGGKLPDISQKTYDAVMAKFDKLAEEAGLTTADPTKEITELA